MNTFKRVAVVLSTLALSVGAMVALPSPAQAAPPQGLATSVLCPDGSGTCTEYRYGFSIKDAGGQLGIYYTVKWSSSGASYRVTRVRLVNNSLARIYFEDIGFVYAGHYYQLRNNSSDSVQASSSVSFTDLSLLGGLSGNGVGKYLPKGSGSYATANPYNVTAGYATAGNIGINENKGAFVLS